MYYLNTMKLKRRTLFVIAMMDHGPHHRLRNRPHRKHQSNSISVHRCHRTVPISLHSQSRLSNFGHLHAETSLSARWTFSVNFLIRENNICYNIFVKNLPSHHTAIVDCPFRHGNGANELVGLCLVHPNMIYPSEFHSFLSAWIFDYRPGNGIYRSPLVRFVFYRTYRGTYCFQLHFRSVIRYYWYLRTFSNTIIG